MVSVSLTLLIICLFGTAHGWGDQKDTPLLIICHIYPLVMKLGTVIPYLRKIKNIYKSCHTILDFYWQQHFFKVNKQILPYQEIQILIAFSYISSNSFNIFSVLKDFVNTSGYNFGMEGASLSCHILKITKNALIFGKKGP